MSTSCSPFCSLSLSVIQRYVMQPRLACPAEEKEVPSPSRIRRTKKARLSTEYSELASATQSQRYAGRTERTPTSGVAITRHIRRLHAVYEDGSSHNKAQALRRPKTSQIRVQSNHWWVQILLSLPLFCSCNDFFSSTYVTSWQRCRM